jgi:sugar/nucleoside kinase (ribokinase family)
MEVLTGMQDLREAAKVLAGWGVKEVLLTLGSLGSLIYAEGQFHEIPAYAPREVVDATGCGDTYMTGYLYRRALGDSYDEAGRFAAAMSTLKLEHTGPFSRTEEDVFRVIREGKTA